MSSNALLWPSQGTIPERRLDKYKYLKLPSQGVGGVIAPPPTGGSALVQTATLSALVQTGTLSALIQTGSG